MSSEAKAELRETTPTGTIEAPLEAPIEVPTTAMTKDSTELVQKKKHIEEDGTVVYIYRKGNKTLKRKYTPNTAAHERREKAISTIRELLEEHPNEKTGSIYKYYLERCHTDQETFIYKLNVFYGLVRKAKQGE